MRAVSRRQGGVVIDEMEAFDIKADLSSGDLSCGTKSACIWGIRNLRC